jgi:hypothetical protein
LAAAWAFVGSFTATAADIVVPIGPDLAALGWRDMPFKNKTPNRYVGHADGRLEVLTERSVSLLFHPIQVDLARTPCLTWRWRVDRTMEPTDLSRKDVDDRPLAVYVAFPHVSAEASMGERLKRILVEQIEGPDTPDRVLIYMWGGLGARGSWFLSPHIGEAGPMRILRPGDSALGVWQVEHVDVEADYRRAFGKAPPPTQYVAVAGDSDDTRSASAATIADLVFRQTCP